MALGQPGHGRMCWDNKCPRISTAAGNKGLSNKDQGGLLVGRRVGRASSTQNTPGKKHRDRPTTGFFCLFQETSITPTGIPLADILHVALCASWDRGESSRGERGSEECLWAPRAHSHRKL